MGHNDRCSATGKRCLTYTEAKKAAAISRRRLHKPASEYRCEACHWWHFGHGRFFKGKGKRPTDR